MRKRRNKASNFRQGLQVVTLCISTSMVLILLGIVVLTAFTGRNLSAYVKENLTVTMELTPETSEQEAQRLCRMVEELPYVQGTDYVSKEQALKEGTKELGTDPSEFAGENPFTAEIDLRLQPNYANNDSIKWIVSTLKTYQGVRDIDYRQDLIDSVNKNLSKISIVLLILAAILTIESFSLINNTIRLSVYSRRFSIHTMKLVGASYNFIRAPFLRSAIGQGLLSVLIAIIVLGIGVYALYCYEPDMTVVLNTQVMIITAAAVLLFGILITLFCSWLSVNKFLKMKAADLYKI